MKQFSSFRIALAALSLAFLGTMTHAQSTPMAVNYQGRLTQPNGLPLTSPTATIRLKIFPVVSGGTASWDSGDRVVILRNGGIFSVMLGDTSVGMPALTQAVFQQGIVYLEVSIAGQAVGPRQPIVSVPWSILSGQATTVADGAITTPKLADSAVTSAKIQNATIAAADLALDRASLYRVSEGKLYLDAPATGLYSILAYNQFGDPNQVSYLDIVGNSSNLRIRGNNPSIEINRAAFGNAWVWGQRTDVGGNNDDLKLLRYANGNYSGIPLQVNLLTGYFSLNGASSLDPLTLRAAAGAYEPAFAIRNNAESQTFRFGYFNGGLDIAASPGAGPVMWLNPNGRVGIGTNVTSSTLQVSEGGNVGGAGGELSFSAYAGTPMASIKGALVLGSTDQVGHLDFYTRPGVGSPLTQRMRIQSDGASYFTGSLGVAGAPNGQAFSVHGNANKRDGGTSWASWSDARLKTGIRDIDNPLAKLLALHGRNYEWRDMMDMAKHNPGTQMGFVAQEAEKVFPDWISTGTNGYKLLNPKGFDALAVEAIREQQTQIERLRRENAALKARFDAQDRKIDAILRQVAKR